MKCTPGRARGVREVHGVSIAAWVLVLGAIAAVVLAIGAIAASPEDAREAMVREQIEARGVSAPRVLAAMRKVPRERFVPLLYRSLAHGDHPLPIGEGQTISQPFIVALMTERLEPTTGAKVLEIGTGSGYQAAVLAELVAEVYTIEIVPSLATRAAATLKDLGYANVHVRAGDGYLGWPEKAPFDAIIVTCAPDAVPQTLVDQLAPAGRMVIPVGADSETQKLVLLRKEKDRLVQHAIEDVRFVPMVRGPPVPPPASAPGSPTIDGTPRTGR
jgi:protein-L-isoaspartate(D-aspartate) O-methyltransferase